MKKNVLKIFMVIACAAFALGFVACGEEMHSHNYTETVTAPTCTEQGYTTYVNNLQQAT